MTEKEKPQRKRAKVMLQEIRLMIVKTALTKREEKREPLADRLIEKIKKRFPKETPPAWETVIKLISKARNESNPLDKPWHLGLLREYPYISAEAVRHIEEAERAVRSYFEGVPVNQDDYHLTVRQALWVSRLYDVVRKHIATDDRFKDFKNVDLEVLFTVSAHYADFELLCDLAGMPCDTSKLDSALSKGINHFSDYVRRENRQGLKEKHFVSIMEMQWEGHEQPHRMEEHWQFVFDPNCPACKKREESGELFKLRTEATRKRISKRKPKGGTK